LLLCPEWGQFHKKADPFPGQPSSSIDYSRRSSRVGPTPELPSGISTVSGVTTQTFSENATYAATCAATIFRLSVFSAGLANGQRKRVVSRHNSDLLLKQNPPRPAFLRVTDSPAVLPPRPAAGKSGPAPTARGLEGAQPETGPLGVRQTVLALGPTILDRWRKALLVVTPETVVRWPRAGFRRY